MDPRLGVHVEHHVYLVTAEYAWKRKLHFTLDPAKYCSVPQGVSPVRTPKDHPSRETEEESALLTQATTFVGHKRSPTPMAESYNNNIF